VGQGLQKPLSRASHFVLFYTLSHSIRRYFDIPAVMEASMTSLKTILFAG
jgi:hypothetical protein